MTSLITRLQAVAYTAVRDKEVHILIAVFSVALIIAAVLVLLLIAEPRSRGVFLGLGIGTAMVVLWVRLCRWVIHRMAHTFDAKLRISKAAGIDR